MVFYEELWLSGDTITQLFRKVVSLTSVYVDDWDWALSILLHVFFSTSR